MYFVQTKDNNKNSQKQKISFTHSTIFRFPQNQLRFSKPPENKPVVNPQDQQITMSKSYTQKTFKFHNVKEVSRRQPQIQVIQRHITPKKFSHNLSATNLRRQYSPFLKDKKVFKKKQINTKNDIKQSKISIFNFKRLSSPKNNRHFCKDKKAKDIPCFLKAKILIPKVCGFRQIKIANNSNNHQKMLNTVMLHEETSMIISLKIIEKQKQINNQQTKLAKLIELNNQFFAKIYRVFASNNHLSFIQQYVGNQNIKSYVKRNKLESQNQIGPRICQIYKALKYLQDQQKSYPQLSQQKIMVYMNMCKLKSQFISVQSSNMKKQISLLGKIAFQLLVDQKQQQSSPISTINQLKHIEKGLKKLEKQKTKISKQFMQFLILTYWSVESDQVTLQKIGQLEFIKLYNERQNYFSQ